MSGAWVIARRELQSYLWSTFGYVILAAVLLIDGLLFNGFALQGQKKSFDVLAAFFYFSSGTVMVASVFISMRLFAEEKQLGTLVLLESAPLKSHSVVLGKFLGAWAFLLLLLLLSGYLPAMILVNGRVTWGHLAAGYLGLALLGAACLALGTLASSLSKNQILSAVLAGAMIVALLLSWMVARKIDGQLGDVIAYLDLFDKHFRAFSRGTIKAESIIYYLSVTYAALLGATAVLSARRHLA